MASNFTRTLVENLRPIYPAVSRQLSRCGLPPADKASRRSTATAAAAAADGEDYNDHEAWYQHTMTSVLPAKDELDGREGPSAVVGEFEERVAAAGTAATSADVKSFDEMPGPRGLPVIGNALSYSKLFGTIFTQFYR